MFFFLVFVIVGSCDILLKVESILKVSKFCINRRKAETSFKLKQTMTKSNDEESDGCETQLIGAEAKPSRLKLAASRVRHFVQAAKDRALTKFHPKIVAAAKKLPLSSESYKLLWIGLAAVAFVLVIWWLFDRKTPASDVDEILRPLSQAPEVS